MQSSFGCGRGLITWDSSGDSEVVGVAVAKEENEMIEGNMVGDGKADDVDGDKFRLLCRVMMPIISNEATADEAMT